MSLPFLSISRLVILVCQMEVAPKRIYSTFEDFLLRLGLRHELLKHLEFVVRVTCENGGRPGQIRVSALFRHDVSISVGLPEHRARAKLLGRRREHGPGNKGGKLVRRH